MRECAWAIYGAGFRFTTLEKNWPALDKAYLRWDYKRIVEQSSAVEQNALQVIAHTGKVKAILAIAKLLNDQGWPEVQAEIFGRITWDARDNPEVSQELLSYLDGLPWVGQVLASYIAKNIGVASIKPDIWMLRLAKWLEYSENEAGVWDMARDFQVETGENIQAIDTVLWNWAKEQPELTEEAV